MTTVIAKNEIRRQHPDEDGKLQVIAPNTSFESEGEELKFLRSKGAVYNSTAQANAVKRAQEGLKAVEGVPGISEVALDEGVDSNKAAHKRAEAAREERAADKDRRAAEAAEREAANEQDDADDDARDPDARKAEGKADKDKASPGRGRAGRKLV